jgi:curved DNA-binding protein CbpA
VRARARAWGPSPLLSRIGRHLTHLHPILAAKKYHPDLNPGNPAAEASFKLVNEAYAVLCDSNERHTYDVTHRFAGLRHHSRPTAAAGSAAYSSPYGRTQSPYADMNPEQRAKAAQYARQAGPGFRSAGAAGAAGRGGSGAWGPGGRPIDPSDHIDFEEWARMNVDTPEDLRREAWARKMAEGRARGYSNFNDASQSAGGNWEARRSARMAAAGWAHATADRGMSETSHYRAWAHSYRQHASSAEKSWPWAAAVWCVVLAAGYVVASRVTAPPSKR